MARRSGTNGEPYRKPRKPSSEWKKAERLKAIKDMVPIFITKTELAKHLGCHITSIDRWIVDGTIPPPHSRPGHGHAVWLRRHFNAYVDTSEWPKDAYSVPAVPE
jgi:hypothetical protein